MKDLEFKGTKGEWKYATSEMNPKKHGFAIVGDYGTRLIADIYRTPSQGKEKSEANAKLIAAAPELLKSLCGLISPGAGGPLRCLKDEGFEEEVKEAQRVIEKALK